MSALDPASESGNRFEEIDTEVLKRMPVKAGRLLVLLNNLDRDDAGSGFDVDANKGSSLHTFLASAEGSNLLMTMKNTGLLEFVPEVGATKFIRTTGIGKIALGQFIQQPGASDTKGEAAEDSKRSGLTEERWHTIDDIRGFIADLSPDERALLERVGEATRENPGYVKGVPIDGAQLGMAIKLEAYNLVEIEPKAPRVAYITSDGLEASEIIRKNREAQEVETDRKLAQATGSTIVSAGMGSPANTMPSDAMSIGTYSISASNIMRRPK